MVPELGKPTDGENLNIAQEVQSFDSLPADVRAILLRVAEILEEMSFGTVVLVVQDSKIVQIETAEKFRFR